VGVLLDGQPVLNEVAFACFDDVVVKERVNADRVVLKRALEQRQSPTLLHFDGELAVADERGLRRRHASKIVEDAALPIAAMTQSSNTPPNSSRLPSLEIASDRRIFAPMPFPEMTHLLRWTSHCSSASRPTSAPEISRSSIAPRNPVLTTKPRQGWRWF
jgi:hypothetical protein